MKATHNGTCQVCGRQQAVSQKDGTIAKHGYTVDFGWFSGACPGSHRKPLENDRSIADQAILDLTAQKEKLEAICETPAELINEIVATVRLPSGRLGSAKVTRADAESGAAKLFHFRNWEWSVSDYKKSINSTIKFAIPRTIEGIQQNIEARHGKELIAR